MCRGPCLDMSWLLCSILVDQEAEAQLAMLATCEVPPAGSNAVAAFLACWTDHAADTRGAYPQRLCALALAKLVASKHPSLSQIQVPLPVAVVPPPPLSMLPASKAACASLCCCCRCRAGHTTRRAWGCARAGRRPPWGLASSATLPRSPHVSCMPPCSCCGLRMSRRRPLTGTGAACCTAPSRTTTTLRTTAAAWGACLAMAPASSLWCAPLLRLPDRLSIIIAHCVSAAMPAVQHPPTHLRVARTAQWSVQIVVIRSHCAGLEG